MKRTRLTLLALAAAGALALSGCASGGGDAGGGETATPEPAPTFAEGSTMAALAEAGTITIGTKFDQPLFGLVGPSGVPEGFDVEIGKIIAGQLGIAEDDIEWVESVSANREPFIQNGEVDIVVATYTINDKRKEVVSFAGPYYMAGQSILVLADNDDIETEDDLVGQPVCSVTGSTPAANLEALGAEVLLTDTYSNCLGAAARRHRRRGLDRQRHPRGPRGPERGRVQGRRRALHRGALRHRPRAGGHRVPRLDQRRAGSLVRGRQLRSRVGRDGRNGSAVHRAAGSRPLLIDRMPGPARRRRPGHPPPEHAPTITGEEAAWSS